MIPPNATMSISNHTLQLAPRAELPPEMTHSASAFCYVSVVSLFPVRSLLPSPLVLFIVEGAIYSRQEKIRENILAASTSLFRF